MPRRAVAALELLAAVRRAAQRRLPGAAAGLRGRRLPGSCGGGCRAPGAALRGAGVAMAVPAGGTSCRGSAARSGSAAVAAAGRATIRSVVVLPVLASVTLHSATASGTGKDPVCPARTLLLRRPALARGKGAPPGWTSTRPWGWVARRWRRQRERRRHTQGSAGRGGPRRRGPRRWCSPAGVGQRLAAVCRGSRGGGPPRGCTPDRGLGLGRNRREQQRVSTSR